MATKLPPGLLDGLRSADPSARLLSVTGLAELVRVSYGAGAAALGLILRESGVIPSLAAILGDGAEARQSALFAKGFPSGVDAEGFLGAEPILFPSGGFDAELYDLSADWAVRAQAGGARPRARAEVPGREL